MTRDPDATPTIQFCRSCGAPIWWGLTRNGKPCPYDIVDGEPTETSHFTTCPDAKAWTRKVK